MRTVCLLFAFALLAACGADDVPPAHLQSAVSCGYCRMTVLDARLASQIVAAGEEPIFFDDLHCLVSYLRARDRTRPLGRVYVSDHRTGAWVRAEQAVYLTDPSRATPMNSHLVAYRDAESRASDHPAGGFTVLTVKDVFGDGEGGVLAR